MNREETLPSMQCDTFTIIGYFTQPGSCLYNVASVTSPIGTTWQDSVCVSVVNVCNVPNAITLPDSSFSLPLNNSYSNSNFVLQGRFYVDDTLTLINCHVYAYPGAQIIVLPTGLLTLDGTTIEGCTQMWRGVRLNKNAKIIMRENSIIMDADTGITALHGSAFDLRFSSVINCIVGIAVPKQMGMNNVQGYVNGCKFGLYATAFKPDYAGQNAHHALPRSCMEFNDVVMTIGDKDTNEFRNSNWGIYSLRSDLTVKTCRFRNMVAAGSLYGTATHKGTAVVAESKTAATAGMITFTNSSIDSCVYGTYTEWTTARVYSINAAHVSAVGSYHLYCNSTGMSTTVNNCNITAGKAGITFQNSERGTMTAAGNAIKVTAGGSSVGINIISTTTNFGNYQIMNNPSIEAVNGSGIVANNAKNVNVINNFVKLSGNTKNGIELTGCDTSTVSCNVISGRYPAQTYQNKGIYSRFNNECYFGCNFTDSTRTGVFFSGSNSGTKFRGNEIKRHNIGLVLDSSAVIDTQAHAGNIWTSIYTSGYGAWNDNWQPNSNLFLSLFITNPSLGATYNPSVPLGVPNDLGWFFYDTLGHTFECDGLLLCTDNPAKRSDGSVEIKEAIASDSAVSSAFVPESKMIAQMDLFKELKEDSVLRSSKTVFENFVSDKENNSIGYLYKTNEKLKEVGSYSLQQQSTLHLADSIMYVYLNEVQTLDSIAANDSTVDNLQARELLMNNIQSQIIIKENIINQVQPDNVSKINQAVVFNSLVSANELPDYNKKVVNEIYFHYLLQGKDTLSAYSSQIFSVATQCPLTGGKAVYVARALMSLLNDTLEYEDNCTQNVNFRLQQNEKVNEIIKNNEIKIIPNPAYTFADVIIPDDYSGICKVKLIDASSRILLEQNFDCSKKKYRIETSTLQSGVYQVQVIINGSINKNSKLIILK